MDKQRMAEFDRRYPTGSLPADEIATAMEAFGVFVRPGQTGTALAGPGVLEVELNAAECAYLGADYPGLLALTDDDVAHLGVSRVMFVRIAINITEHAFTRLVMGIAEAEDVLAHHCGKAEDCKGGPGFPDLVLAGRERVLFAELKRLYQAAVNREGWGVRSLEQVTWGERLRAASEYAVWTPPDLLTIRPQLQKLHVSHMDELLADG